MEPDTADLKLVEPSSTDSLMPNPLGWQEWSAIGIGALLLACLIVWLWRRSQRPPEINAGELLKKAHDEAVSALAICPSDERTPAATECSLILRRYLAVLTGDPALFETHEEWVTRHDAIENLNADLKQQTRNLFNQLAEWKYAKVDDGEEPAVVIDRSRSLLEALNREVAT